MYVPPPPPKPFKRKKIDKKYDYKFGKETAERAKIDRSRPEKERITPSVMKARELKKPSS